MIELNNFFSFFVCVSPFLSLSFPCHRSSLYVTVHLTILIRFFCSPGWRPHIFYQLKKPSVILKSASRMACHSSRRRGLLENMGATVLYMLAHLLSSTSRKLSRAFDSASGSPCDPCMATHPRAVQGSVSDHSTWLSSDFVRSCAF